VPLESLPYIDEHAVDVAASAEATWEALVGSLTAGGSNRRGRLLAERLGCEPSVVAGEPGMIGATIPGFIVTRSVRPAVLALVGEHRFARYALIFRIDETLAGPVRLRAESRAEWKGRRGRAYRALVIGTRGHVVATQSILRSVRKRAERGVETSGTGNTIA
jgi:hypothetical protein